MLDNDVQILDLETDLIKRFTFAGTMNSIPLWTHDGQSIVFFSDRGSKFGLWQKKATFTDEAKLVFPESDINLWPISFSYDGRILFGGALRRGTDFDLWDYTLGQTNVGPRFILERSVNELWPALSPDGRWLVYHSDGQLYVKRYDEEGTIQQLTMEGGGKPRWSKKGDRIYYSNLDAIWSIEMTVEGEAMSPGTPDFVVKE